jgi:hypothetical protein
MCVGTCYQTCKEPFKANCLRRLKDGRVINLDTPEYLYEANLLNANKVGEILVTLEGQVTEGPKWIVRPL